MDKRSKKNGNDVTLNDLADMVRIGFDEVHGRLDDTNARMATKEMLQLVVDDVDTIRADVRDIKITLGPLVRTVAA